MNKEAELLAVVKAARAALAIIELLVAELPSMKPLLTAPSIINLRAALAKLDEKNP